MVTRVVAALVVLGALLLGARLPTAHALPVASSPAPRPEPVFDLGLAFAIPRDGAGARVVDDAWVNAQIADANRLFAPFGIRVRWTLEEDLAPRHREAHSREDRDALAPLVVPGHARIVVVTHLEDVDEPGRRRMGVCWTARNDGRRYILLASYAAPTVLAHELGHLLGNGHSKVPDNLMSYERTGGGVFLDATQGARARAKAAALLAAGTLVDVGPPRRIP